MGGGLTCLPGQGAHYLTNTGVRADMGDTPLPAPSSFPPVSCLIHTETHIYTQTHTHRHTHRDIHTHTDTHIEKNTETHTQTHTEVHTHTDTHTDTHRHTPIGTHTLTRSSQSPCPGPLHGDGETVPAGLGRGRGAGSWQTMAGGPPQRVHRGKRLLCVQRGQMASATAPAAERLAICTRPSCQLCRPWPMLGLPTPSSHLLRGGSDSFLMLPTALCGSHCPRDQALG